MDQLLVALDVHSLDDALVLADRLRGIVGGFKIGSTLFTAEGPRAVRAFVDRGDRVFLDLKFHDIPNTVAGAVAAATDLGVWMLNVHASGGARMMRAARDAALEAAAAGHREPPLVIAVTALTSLDDETLAAIGVQRTAMDHVLALADLARTSGLDGVVASPRETAAIRSRAGAAFSIVTPGIRAAGPSRMDDQARTMTAADAIQAGASYLVVGRPIVAAADPRAAAERIAAEIEWRSA
jgi:orotidine-5'-phosphate decarboxylase